MNVLWDLKGPEGVGTIFHCAGSPPALHEVAFQVPIC